MSKLVKYFAALVLIAGAMAITPNVASAQRHHGGGGWHGGGWHGGGWHDGGWHGGGWHGRRHWGGWGPGFAFGFGAGYPYYYGGPYYVQGDDCGWVRVRVWRHGHRVIRRAWRCW